VCLESHACHIKLVRPLCGRLWPYSPYSCPKYHFWRKSHRKGCFLSFEASFLKEVSQKSFVFEFPSFIFGGSLAEKLRLRASKLHFWRTSRRKAWFLSFEASFLKEVSQKSFVLEVRSSMLSIYLSIHLSIYLSICLSIYIYRSIDLSISISIYRSIDLSSYLSIYLSLSLSLYLSISLSIYLSIWKWRQWFSGTQGGKFKQRSRMETMVWWNAGGEV